MVANKISDAHMELLNSVNSQYSLRKSTVKINVENPKIYDLECIGF